MRELIVEGVKLKSNITNETNICETKIVPIKPKTIGHEQIEVYIPNANYAYPGIAKFDENQFIVDSVTGLVKIRSDLPTYELTVSIDDDLWRENTTTKKWEIKINQVEHNIKKIHNVIAERKMDVNMYENMLYSYRRYISGSISIIVDEKINMRIIIKGEK